MTTTNFSAGTVIASTWLNDVDGTVYGDSSAVANFTQTGTGAVARQANSKFKEWVSVEDFYNAADGANADTLAINRAIAAISDTRGGIVRFTKIGDYSITSTITCLNKQNLRLEGPAPGAGGGAAIGARLVWNGAGGGTVVMLDACAHGEIKDLQIVNGTANYGVGIDWDKVSGSALATHMTFTRVLWKVATGGIGCRISNVADGNHEDGTFNDCYMYGPGNALAGGLDPGTAGTSIGLQIKAVNSFGHRWHDGGFSLLNVCVDLVDNIGGKSAPGGGISIYDPDAGYCDIFLRTGLYLRHPILLKGGSYEFPNQFIQTADVNGSEPGTITVIGTRCVAPSAETVPFIIFRNQGKLVLLSNDFIDSQGYNASWIIKLGIGGAPGTGCIAIGNTFPNLTPFDTSAGRNFWLRQTGNTGLDAGGLVNVMSDIYGGYNTYQSVATTFMDAVALGVVTLVYSATIATDAFAGNTYIITVTNGTAFTISNPTNPTTGQRITYRIRNTSGGAVGVITWGAAFKLAAWASPATAFSRSIDFEYDGTNWVEVFRTPADVPN